MIGELETVCDSPVAFSPEEPEHTSQAPRPQKVREGDAESTSISRTEGFPRPKAARTASGRKIKELAGPHQYLSENSRKNCVREGTEICPIESTAGLLYGCCFEMSARCGTETIVFFSATKGQSNHGDERRIG